MREAANRIKCANNLKQLGLAGVNYHDTYGHFPMDNSGWLNLNPPYASAFIALLPYLEQESLSNQFNAAGGVAAWGTPLAAASLPLLVCPSDSGLTSAQISTPDGNHVGVTSYRDNVGSYNWWQTDGSLGQDGVISIWQLVKMTFILDGTSSTIMFGEFANFDSNLQVYLAYYGIPSNYPALTANSIWTTGPPTQVSGFYPLNYRLPPLPSNSLSVNIAVMTRVWCYGSSHIHGANFVFCDGSLHFISDAVSTVTLSALCTRAGGEVIGNDW